MYKFVWAIVIAVLIPGAAYTAILRQIPTQEREINKLKSEIEEKKKELNVKIMAYEKSIDLEKIEHEMMSKNKMKVSKELEVFEMANIEN
jgi:SHS2 domain-containing protein